MHGFVHLCVSIRKNISLVNTNRVKSAKNSSKYFFIVFNGLSFMSALSIKIEPKLKMCLVIVICDDFLDTQVNSVLYIKLVI